MSHTPHLSSEELDLLELGSLDTADAARATAHLSDCAACSAQRDEAARSASHFRQFVQPRTLGAVTARTSPRRLALRWPALCASILAAAVLAVVTVRLATPAQTDRPYVGIRGEAIFQAIVARGDTQQPLAPGMNLRAGDRLRFRVVGGAASYVLVLARDGAGAWSVYAPFGGARSAPVSAETQLLPGAVELDDTRGREHLVAVFSEAPLEAAAVIDHLRDRPLPPATGVLDDVPGARSVQVIAFEKP